MQGNIASQSSPGIPEAPQAAMEDRLQEHWIDYLFISLRSL
jgi:hypothetical protein